VLEREETLTGVSEFLKQEKKPDFKTDRRRAGDRVARAHREEIQVLTKYKGIGAGFIRRCFSGRI